MPETGLGGGGWKMPTVLYWALNMVKFFCRCCWWWRGGWGNVWGGKGESNDYRTWLGCRLWAVMRVVLGFWLFNKSQCDINLIFFFSDILIWTFFFTTERTGMLRFGSSKPSWIVWCAWKFERGNHTVLGTASYLRFKQSRGLLE